MGRRRAAAPVQRLPGAPIEYQCARVDETWHATQEQAAPPSIHQGGAYTICAVWASFVRGYERRRPTCAFCLRACERDEGIYVEPPPMPVAVPVSVRTPAPAAAAPARAQKPVAPAPPPAAAVTAAVTQKLRDANAAQEADFAARLNALVEKTKNRR